MDNQPAGAAIPHGELKGGNRAEDSSSGDVMGNQRAFEIRIAVKGFVSSTTGELEDQREVYKQNPGWPAPKSKEKTRCNQ